MRYLSVAILSSFWAAPLFAVTITVSPGSQAIPLGATASIDLNISGLGNNAPPSVGVYDLTIGFDSALLAFSSIIWGGGLDVLGLGSIQSLVPGTGSINVFELSLDSANDLNSLQPDAFRLFTVNFSTLALGTSPLFVTVNAIGDADGVDLPTTLGSGAIEVGSSGMTSVPEPNTLHFVAISSIAIYLWGKRSAVLRTTEAKGK